MNEIRVGAHTVALSNQGKLLFPDAGLTKGDLFDYYHRIAGRMLPYLTERPLTLHCFPNGIYKKGFIDTLRNAYGQTAVPSYAVRARPGAPVATPLDWDGWDNPDLHPQRYTIRNLFQRLSQKNDPWSGFGRHACALTTPRRRLADLHSMLL